MNMVRSFSILLLAACFVLGSSAMQFSHSINGLPNISAYTKESLRKMNKHEREAIKTRVSEIVERTNNQTQNLYELTDVSRAETRRYGLFGGVMGAGAAWCTYMASGFLYNSYNSPSRKTRLVAPAFAELFFKLAGVTGVICLGSLAIAYFSHLANLKEIAEKQPKVIAQLSKILQAIAEIDEEESNKK